MRKRSKNIVIDYNVVLKELGVPEPSGVYDTNDLEGTKIDEINKYGQFIPGLHVFYKKVRGSRVPDALVLPLNSVAFRYPTHKGSDFELEVKTGKLRCEVGRDHFANVFPNEYQKLLEVARKHGLRFIKKATGE